VLVIAYAPAGNGLVVGRSGRPSLIANTTTMRVAYRWKSVENSDFLAYSPDGKTLVGCNPPFTELRLYAAEDGKLLASQSRGTPPDPKESFGREPPHGTPLRAQFSPDGKLIAAGCDDGTVYLFDAGLKGRPPSWRSRGEWWHWHSRRTAANWRSRVKRPSISSSARRGKSGRRSTSIGTRSTASPGLPTENCWQQRAAGSRKVGRQPTKDWSGFGQCRTVKSPPLWNRCAAPYLRNAPVSTRADKRPTSGHSGAVGGSNRRRVPCPRLCVGM
jgi:hypothetical protein